MMKWRMKNWIQMLRLISPSRLRDLPSSPDYSSLPKHPLQRPSRCLKRRKRLLMSKMPRMLPRQKKSPQPLSKHLSRPRKRERKPQRPPNMRRHLPQKPGELLDLPTSWLQAQHRQSALARRVLSIHGFEPRSTQTDQARNALLENHWLRLLPKELDLRRYTAAFFCFSSSLLFFVHYTNNSFWFFSFVFYLRKM